MSGFLGGVDLGTPAERVERALTRDLELQRKLWTPASEQTMPVVYAGSADLVLREGVFNVGRPLPDAYEHLFQLVGPSLCFYNALKAVQADPTLRYCEGYCTLGRGEPWLHAWCLAPDGGMVEVTYEDEGHPTAASPTLATLPAVRWGYYGVVLHADYVAALQTDESGAMLERLAPEMAGARRRDWTAEDLMTRANYPVLAHPYDPNRTSP
jgi:hypothetical protein